MGLLMISFLVTGIITLFGPRQHKAWTKITPEEGEIGDLKGTPKKDLETRDLIALWQMRFQDTRATRAFVLDSMRVENERLCKPLIQAQESLLMTFWSSESSDKPLSVYFPQMPGDSLHSGSWQLARGESLIIKLPPSAAGDYLYVNNGEERIAHVRPYNRINTATLDRKPFYTACLLSQNH